MLIRTIKLKNYRCFINKSYTFEEQFVVIQGKNGSGKTSLLEALHYSCYLRSFRTNLNRDLITLDKDHFFIQVNFDLETSGSHDHIQIGFSQENGKLVKLNKKPIQSYKELVSHYRLVTLTADDITLVNGSPGYRRDFLNYSLLILSPELIPTFKKYKKILEQRNSMIHNSHLHNTASFDEQFIIWSKKLWETSLIIQKERILYLSTLEQQVNFLLKTYFISEELHVTFEYCPKNMLICQESFEQFWTCYSEKKRSQEFKFRRGLFGAHLDDFAIIFQSKKARIFASRGQQKLLAFLIKIAQLQQTLTRGEKGVLLLDDFLTDFDPTKIEQCMNILDSLSVQVFITTPIQSTMIINGLKNKKHCLIEL